MQLPSEVLRITLQYLAHHDLLNCSYTCWSWNQAANVLLYYKVYGFGESMFEKLLRTITPIRLPSDGQNSNATSRRQQLGQLVKVVVMRKDDSFRDFSDWYLPLLPKLAFATPNVHTASLYDPCASATMFSSSYRSLSFDWNEAFGSNWLQLKKLKLEAPSRSGFHEGGMINIMKVFERLQSLDITYCSAIVMLKLPYVPAMPFLECFKARVLYGDDYQRIKALTNVCRNRFHTLALIWQLTIVSKPPVTLDDLTLELPNLKSFGFSYFYSRNFTISSFGAHLEELELLARDCRFEDQVDSLIGKAMMKMSKLKTLSLITCCALLEYIPMVIESNKGTLQKFYFSGKDGDKLIEDMVASNLRAYHVTTLYFEYHDLDKSMVRHLAEIFPHVQFLTLTRGKARSVQSWLSLQTLQVFKNLIGLGTTTCSELLDPSKCKFDQFVIQQPIILSHLYAEENGSTHSYPKDRMLPVKHVTIDI